MIDRVIEEEEVCLLTAEEDEVLVVEACGGELGPEHVDGVVHVQQHVSIPHV